MLVGNAAFNNAREPLAQAFKIRGTGDADAFGVVNNHFKSKGSGTPDPDGQGNANVDRVAQANGLLAFAAQFQAERGIERMFLVGDFNAYSEEDPVQEIEQGARQHRRHERRLHRARRRLRRVRSPTASPACPGRSTTSSPTMRRWTT